MSHNITPAEIQLDKQELYEFVDESSKWRMKDKGDVKKYATVFWYCCDPLIAFHYMSLGECEDLFWQGFHPDTHVQFPPDAKQQTRDILQRTPSNCQAPPTSSSPAHTPSPPAPKTPTSLVNLVASAQVAPADPSPTPSTFPRTPTLSTALMPSLPSSVSPPSPACNVSPPPTPKQPSAVSPIRRISPPPSAQSRSSSVSPLSPVSRVSPPPPIQVLPLPPSPSSPPSVPTAERVPLSMHLRSLLPTPSPPSPPPPGPQVHELTSPPPP